MLDTTRGRYWINRIVSLKLGVESEVLTYGRCYTVTAYEYKPDESGRTYLELQVLPSINGRVDVDADFAYVNSRDMDVD